MDVLPIGVIPVTSVVTVLRYGERTEARIRLRDGAWMSSDVSAIVDYVTEERNPGNRKGVIGAEVFLPSDLLACGMSLVDTPGLGAVTEADEVAAEAFIPHIDAAVVVLGADPPISRDELALIERIADRTPRLLYVLNKADRVGEADRQEATRFTERVLEEKLGRSNGAIFNVSALGVRQHGEQRYEWDRFVAALGTLARTAGGDMLRDAETRGIQALSHALRAEIDVQRDALVRPLEESEARINALRDARQRAEEALQDLGHRLRGVQAQLLHRFTEERDAFVARTLPKARSELGARISEAAHTPSLRREASIAITTDVAMRWLERWEREQAPRAEGLYRDVTARFVDLVRGVVEDLARIPGLERLSSLSVETGFRAKRQLRYTRMLHTAPTSARMRIVDMLRTPRARQRAIVRDALVYLERLLEVNSARIKNDFSDRVVESRRALESDLQRRLADVSASAERGLIHAHGARARGAEAVRERLEWLERRRARVNSVCIG